MPVFGLVARGEPGHFSGFPVMNITPSESDLCGWPRREPRARVLTGPGWRDLRHPGGRCMRGWRRTGPAFFVRVGGGGRAHRAVWFRGLPAAGDELHPYEEETIDGPRRPEADGGNASGPVESLVRGAHGALPAGEGSAGRRQPFTGRRRLGFRLRICAPDRARRCQSRPKGRRSGTPLMYT